MIVVKDPVEASRFSFPSCRDWEKPLLLQDPKAKNVGSHAVNAGFQSATLTAMQTECLQGLNQKRSEHQCLCSLLSSQAAISPSHQSPHAQRASEGYKQRLTHHSSALHYSSVQHELLMPRVVLAFVVSGEYQGSCRVMERVHLKK